MEHWLLTRYHLHRDRGNCRKGILGEQCADNADRQVTVDDIMRKLHKMITQINCTNRSHKTRRHHGQEWKSQMMLSDAPEQLRCIWST